MTLYRTIYSQKKNEFYKTHSKEILDMVHADPRYVEYKTNKAKASKKVEEGAVEPRKEEKTKKITEVIK